MSKIIEYVKYQFRENATYSKYNMIALGIMGSIYHPIYWLWWTFISPRLYENAVLRSVGALSCFLLLLHRFWPKGWVKFLSFYYFFTVTFNLPFFFTYYLFISNYSFGRSVAQMAMIFFSILLLPSIIVWLISFILGIFFAVLLVISLHPTFLFVDRSTLLDIYLPTFAYGIFSAIAINYSHDKSISFIKDTAARLKYQTMKTLAGSIAHEIRNPLGRLKLAFEGIERHLSQCLYSSSSGTTVLSEKTEVLYEYLQIGTSSLKQSFQIISMILEEIKENPIDIASFSFMDAAQITQKAIQEYSYATEEESFKIKIHLKQNFIFKGNETLYFFTIFNLINNALYYASLNPLTKITITIDRQRVIVSDTGPGIPAERLFHLFEPFQTSGKTGGTGLGLPFCKRVMEAFGGTIKCESIFGRYTAFILEFPKVTASTSSTSQKKISELSSAVLYGKKILLVRPLENALSFEKRLLKSWDLYIEQINNGELVLLKLAESFYDLLILDLHIQMPNAYEITRKIRSGAIQGYEKIPIIFLIPQEDKESQAKAEKAGVEVIINRPIEPVRFFQDLVQILDKGKCGATKIKQPFSAPLAGKFAIIADDSEINRNLLRIILEEWGMKVLEAHHGASVLKKLEEYPFCDVILLDMHMPGMDGIETTCMIRTHQSIYQNIPIIGITGESDANYIESAYLAGIQSHVIKPIAQDILLNKLLAVFTIKPFLLSLTDILNTQRLQLFKIRGIFKDGIDNSYVRQTNEWLIQLEKSVENQNFKNMQDALHFLKGSSKTIGADKFGEFVEKLELQTKKGEWPREENWLDKVKLLHRETLIALKMYFDKSIPD